MNNEEEQLNYLFWFLIDSLIDWLINWLVDIFRFIIYDNGIQITQESLSTCFECAPFYWVALYISSPQLTDRNTLRTFNVRVCYILKGSLIYPFKVINLRWPAPTILGADNLIFGKVSIFQWIQTCDNWWIRPNPSFSTKFIMPIVGIYFTYSASNRRVQE